MPRWCRELIPTQKCVQQSRADYFEYPRYDIQKRDIAVEFSRGILGASSST